MGKINIYRPAIEMEGGVMNATNILLIVLIVLLVGAFPSWPYSQTWGYAPSGGLGLLVIIFIVYLLFGRR